MRTGRSTLLLLALAACHGAVAPRPDGGATSTGSGGDGGAAVGAGGSAPGTGGCALDDAGADAGAGCDGLAGGVMYSADIAPILTQNCSGELCHVTPSYDSLVGVKAGECCDGRLLVAPGDADHSYLVDKIAGVHLCSGGRMPLAQPPLADADVLLVRRWICEGAPHD